MTETSENPLRRLTALGQSVWYDYIRRDLYTGPELSSLITRDSLRGMTSNPTIFETAVVQTDLYDSTIRTLAAGGSTPEAIAESLAIEDVCAAADVFRRVYDETGGTDGFVSIEVRPQLTHDTAGSVNEARRLWAACRRPNIMIKIPATDEGVLAIRQCLAEGINVNITLLFSLSRYRQVIDAYLQAVDERVRAGRPVDGLRSVASFFVSRVDAYVDKLLRDKSLEGKAAIANARLAYQLFREVFASKRTAAVQRPLWASMSVKNPALPPLYYMEALVAADSVSTVPPETFAAYRESGNPAVRISDDLDGAHEVLRRLADLGIDLDAVGRALEEDGSRRFIQSYDKLVSAIGKKAERLLKSA